MGIISKSNTPAKNIVLLWHNYPSENLGVSALTYSHFNLIENILAHLEIEANYLIIGMNSPDENYFDAITTRHAEYRQFSIRNMLKHPGEICSLFKVLSQSNLVLDLGSGDSFTDIYGATRFAQILFSKFLVLLAKSPLVLSPQTIGPFYKWYGKLFSDYIFHRSAQLFVRDNLSYEYLKNRGYENKLKLVTDLAFALPFDKKAFSFDTNAVNVGINVSGLLFNGGYNKSNQFKLTLDYPRFTREVIKMFNCMPTVKVHLIPHVISDHYEIEDDYRVCQCLQQEYPECLLAPRFSSPIQAKSYIANLDFFTGARMHSTIAAFSSGVPVVPVAYSRKFRGVFGSLNYEILVDGQIDNVKKGLDIIRSAFDNSCNLRDNIIDGNNKAKKQLANYRQFLENILTSI